MKQSYFKQSSENIISQYTEHLSRANYKTSNKWKATSTSTQDIKDRGKPTVQNYLLMEQLSKLHQYREYQDPQEETTKSYDRTNLPKQPTLKWKLEGTDAGSNLVDRTLY